MDSTNVTKVIADILDNTKLEGGAAPVAGGMYGRRMYGGSAGSAPIRGGNAMYEAHQAFVRAIAGGAQHSMFAAGPAGGASSGGSCGLRAGIIGGETSTETAAVAAAGLIDAGAAAVPAPAPVAPVVEAPVEGIQGGKKRRLPPALREAGAKFRPLVKAAYAELKARYPNRPGNVLLTEAMTMASRKKKELERLRMYGMPN